MEILNEILEVVQTLLLVFIALKISNSESKKEQK